MTTPVHGLVCPSCGAGLGDAEPDGERVCRYCGQHVVPDADRHRLPKEARIDFNEVFAKMDERERRAKKGE